MSDKLYYSDGYLRETEATVIAVSDRGIKLDRTVFYPEAGGQPGDRGFFGDFRIVDTVKDDDGEPLHIIDGDKPAVGTKALLSLDWDHRYAYMKAHSAQHLLSAILFRHGIGTVSVHLGESFISIESDADSIDEDVLLSVEDEANEAIRDGRRIEQREMSHEDAEALHMRRSIKVSGPVKVVFIDGLDAVACGGVHVRSTCEIGEIQHFGSEKIRGHVRTMWKCADLSVAYRRGNRRIVSELSALLSAEPDGIVEAAEKLSSENAELRRSVKNMGKKAAFLEYSLRKMSSKPGEATIFMTDLDISFFDEVLGEDDEDVLFVVDGNGRFMFHGAEEGFRTLKAGLSAYSIRGGGRGRFFRGSASGDVHSMIKEAGVLLNG